MASYDSFEDRLGYHRRVLDSMRNSMASVAGIPSSNYYSYTITDYDEQMLRLMLKQMPPREAKEQIERSQRYCLETNDQRGLARAGALIRRLGELEYVNNVSNFEPHWSTAELNKIKSTNDSEFDIGIFLKKVNPIKLKQEE